MITIRYIENVINKKVVHSIRDVEWEGKTISELAPDGSVGCVIKGGVVAKNSASWNQVPNDGEVLIYVAMPTDPATAAAITGFIFEVLFLVGTVAIITGVVVGLASLFGLLPSSAGLLSGIKSSKKESATFGFDRIANTIGNGVSIPVVYGEHIMGGHYIQAYRTAGPDRSQTFHALIAVSEGPIQAIGQYTTDQDNLTAANLPTGMTINDVDVIKFEGVEVGLRIGNAEQQAIQGFQDVVVEYPQEFTLDFDTFEWTTLDKVNEIAVQLVFPSGLFKAKKQGGTTKTAVRIRLKILDADESTVVFNETFEIRDHKKGGRAYAELRAENLNLRDYIVQVSRVLPFPPAYLSGGKKQKQDKVAVIAVHEITYAQLRYPGLALVGVHIKASEQISGAIPTVLSTLKGKKVVTDPTFADQSLNFSDNPAFIAIDIQTNKLYGMGSLIETSFISNNAVTWQEYADYCDELIPRYTLAVGLNEKQVVTITGGPTGGTFTLALGGDTTTGITFDARSSAVQTALEALSNIGTGNVTVTGSAGGPWTAEFIADHANENITEMVANGANLTGGSSPDAFVSTTQNGAPDNEKRFTFNGVFDVQKPGWEQVLTIGAMSRAIFLKVGNDIKVKLEKQKSAVQLFNMGNIKEGSLEVVYVNPNDRFNHIEISFPNIDLKYEKDQVVAAVPGLDDVTGSVKRKEIELFGVTRISQALRYAWYALRVEQMTQKLFTFEVGVDSIVAESGDVCKIAHDMPDWSFSGRVAGVDGSSNVTLDRVITFEADVLYTYVEKDNADNTLLTQDIIFASQTTTDQLGFNPLHGVSGAQSRLWIIGPKLKTETKGLILSITSSGEDFTRKIECLEFIPQVYGDDSESLDDGAFLEEGIIALNPVTNIAIVESSTVPDVSRLTVTFDSPIDAKSFALYHRPKGTGDEFIRAGEAINASRNEVQVVKISGNINVRTGTFTLEFNDVPAGITAAIQHDATAEEVQTALEGLAAVGVGDVLVTGFPGGPYDIEFKANLGYQGISQMSVANSMSGGAASISTFIQGVSSGNTIFFDWPNIPLGATVEVLVQTINTEGRRLSLLTAPTKEYIITRDDDGTALITFPANVTNLQITGSEIVRTLSWDAVAGADLYDVRVGSWQAGKTIHASSALSLDIRLSPVPRDFLVCAKIGNYFSPDPTKVTSVSQTHLSWPVAKYNERLNFGLSSIGIELDTLDPTALIYNGEGVAVNATNSNEWHTVAPLGVLLAIDPEREMEYLSKVFDLGTAASTYVGWHLILHPFFDLDVDELFMWDSQKHLGFFGHKSINDFIVWTFRIEYSSDGVNFNSRRIDTDYLDNVAHLGRYFRFRLRANSKLKRNLNILDPPDAENDNILDEFVDFFARTLVEDITISLSRAT